MPTPPSSRTPHPPAPLSRTDSLLSSEPREEENEGAKKPAEAGWWGEAGLLGGRLAEPFKGFKANVKNLSSEFGQAK